MSPVWQGVVYDGRTAAGKPVTVEVGTEGLVLLGEDGSLCRYPFAELNLVQGQRKGEPVRLEHQGASLVVDGTDILASLPAAARRRLLRPPVRKRLVPMVAALFALLLAGSGGFIFFMPPLIDLLAERIPPAWEERLGDQVAARWMTGFEACNEPGVEQMTAAVMARLEKALPENPYQLRVTVVKDGMVNAFALPGGQIVIMGGLLAAAASPEELAGVLAHETTHILRRHATRAMLKNASSSLLLHMFFGNDNLGGLAAGGLQTLAQLRHSRKHEQEADRFGLELLLSAGIDPQGFIDFLAHLEDREEEVAMPIYFSTHPAPADRIRALERTIAGRPQEEGGPVLIGQEEWLTLHESCQ